MNMQTSKNTILTVLSILLSTLPLAAETPQELSPQAKRELRRTPVVAAHEQVRDSVVNISASGRVEVQRWGRNLFGDLFAVPLVREQRSVGSGFILHPDGYIATNAHVVSAGTQLSVTLANGKEYEARVIGRDNRRDLAVIKIDAEEPLPPIKLGRSDDLMIGEQTIAVGNPVGLHNTVTTGVISAIHRELDVGGSIVYPDVIQTDASINPGSSGGPLLNILGELIGVNTAIRTDAQNIGFAIPVDDLREIIADILDSEKLNRAVIGMRVAGTEPVKVAAVSEGGPADRAGIKAGDVVASLEGEPLQAAIEFYVAMLSRKAGEYVPLTLVRNGKSIPAQIKIEELPQPDGASLALTMFGLRVADAKDEVMRRFQLRKKGGVIVLSVETGSPAERAGLQPGDLLISLGSYWLTDVDQLGSLLGQVETGDPVDVGFRRVGRGQLTEWEGRLYVR
jgi:serine protease Do